MSIARNGKYVIVTGASSGIGEQIAYNFAQRGYGIISVSRRQATNLQNEEKFRDLEHVHFSCDLGKIDQTIALIGNIKSLNKRLSGIVYCCGGLHDNPSREPKEWIGVHDHNKNFNLDSYFLLINSFLPELVERDEGFIVSTSSAGGFSNNCVMFQQYKAPLLLSSLSIQHHLDMVNSQVKAYCLPVSSLFNEDQRYDKKLTLPLENRIKYANKVVEICTGQRDSEDGEIIFSDDATGSSYSEHIIQIANSIKELTKLEEYHFGFDNLKRVNYFRTKGVTQR